jgi:hypothetical protein
VARLALGYPRTRGLPHLAAREVVFIESVSEAMFPVDGAIPVSGLEADLPGYVDRYLPRLQPAKAFQIRLLLLLFEQATIFFPGPGTGGFRRFSSQSLDARVAVLGRWQQSRLGPRRFVFAVLRAVLTMGYLGHPAVLRRLRLAPLAFETPVCEADLLYPPIGQGPDAIAFGPDDLTPPSDGTPLDLSGPFHPDYAEARSDGDVDRS